ncbi:hypothetical protein J4210_04735 [Candidatus Woesearchaeota archaeon]|nr:hypothetical protein [Candidatus Woesearchaeota archaeon]
MLHLNAQLRERYGLFSRQALESIFRDPELYVAGNIADLKTARIKKTRYKLFSPGNKLPDKSIIFIQSCSVEMIRETAGEFAAESGEKQIRPFIQAVPNAFISDDSGKLPIICPFKIEQTIRLENVLLYYYHRLGLYRLEHSVETPSQNVLTKTIQERIINLKESFSATLRDN